MSFFISGPNVPSCDIYRPLRSSIGVGPRGESITVEEVDGDPYGCYRLEFKTESGSPLLTTPNIDPGSRVYVCNKNFDSLVESGVYTANKTDFPSGQPSPINDIRVGDIVIFNVIDNGIGYIGIGIVDSIGNNGSVTFHRNSFIHDGSTGQRGPAGVSPVVTVTDTDTGVRISVTDESGTTTADIVDGAHWYSHDGSVDGDYVHVRYYDSNSDPDDLYLPIISGGSGESGVSGGKIDSNWLPIAGDGVLGGVQVKKYTTEATITSSDGSINVPTVSGEPGHRYIGTQYLPLATSESRGAIGADDKIKLDHISDNYIVTSAAMVLENIGESDDDWRQRVKLTVSKLNASSNEWEQVTYYLPYAPTAGTLIPLDMLPHASVSQSGIIDRDNFLGVVLNNVKCWSITAGNTTCTIPFEWVVVGSGPQRVNTRRIDVQVRDSTGNPVEFTWNVSVSPGGDNFVFVTLDSAAQDTVYVTVSGNIA